VCLLACSEYLRRHPPPPQVVAGAPGSRLVDLVVSPQALVQQDSRQAGLRLNATYYITKQVRQQQQQDLPPHTNSNT